MERTWEKPTIERAVSNDDDLFIILGASCQESPDVEQSVEKSESGLVVLFNVKFDSARGDVRPLERPHMALSRPSYLPSRVLA